MEGYILVTPGKGLRGVSAMTTDMKTVTISNRSKYRILHIEVPGCIVNIHIGLTNIDGNPVTNVSITADQFAGDKKWMVVPDNGKPRDGIGVRVVREA